jgi:hypothetical protein
MDVGIGAEIIERVSIKTFPWRVIMVLNTCTLRFGPVEEMLKFQK